MGNLRLLGFLGLPRLSGFITGTHGGNLRALWFGGLGGLKAAPLPPSAPGALNTWRGAYNIWHRSSTTSE